MFKINKKLEYALIALEYVGQRPDELTSAKAISDQTGVPFDGLARVMQILAQKEILNSEKGVGGGYSMAHKFDEISFYTLMEVVLGQTNIAKCLHSSESCDLESTCNIKTPINKLNAKLVQFYSELSIREVLKLPKAQKPFVVRPAL